MAIDVTALSQSNQDYLKALFTLSEWREEPVTAKVLADKVGVRLSSASDAVRRLEKMDLVDHTPYGAIALTARGREYALAMVRRHRLLECFLVETLQYSWDQVHAEAENLEHSVSDFMIERIDAVLGHPRHDPHGDPIPTAAGDYPDAPEDSCLLAQAAARGKGAGGGEFVVERIHDGDPQLLQYLSEHGLVVGAVVRVEPAGPYAEATQVRIAGSEEPLLLGAAALGAITVRPQVPDA